MIVIAPFILFFSYTKSYKKSKVDTMMPEKLIKLLGL